jgi:hypothetical protein
MRQPVRCSHLMSVLASLLLSAAIAGHPPTRVVAPIETEARELLAYFTAGDFAAASKDFDDAMRAIVTPAVLADMKRQVETTLGKFVSIKDVRQRRADGFRNVELTAQYTKSRAILRVQFDPLDRVRAVFLDPLVDPKPDAKRERIARELLANVVAGRFDEAARDFAPTLRVQLPASRLAQLARDLTSHFGTFSAVAEVTEKSEPGVTQIDLLSQYDRSRVVVSVVFDADGRVSGLKVTPAGP